jgi:hypothetical protein
MATQYTEITLEEMDTFLKRSFRALRPKQFTKSGAVYYDLTLGPNVAVRIWTTIGTWGSTKGKKSMKVQLYGPKVNRRLVHEEAVRMKRTQNWRSTLQDNIEEFLELYESKPEYWEQNASGDHKQVEPERDDERVTPEKVEERRPPPRSGPPASDKQINYILSMASRASRDQLIHLNLKHPMDAQEIRELSLKEASALIGALINYGLNRRYSSEDQPPRADLDVRAILRQEVLRSFQAEEVQGRISCEGGCSGNCDKSECTCGGECTCGKKAAAPVVSQVLPIQRTSPYEDPVIASILNELLV